MNKYINIFLSCPFYSKNTRAFRKISQYLQPIFNKKDKPYYISIGTEQTDSNICKENFKDYFEDRSKLPFTYENHMDWRLKQLNKAHCMIILSDNLTFENSVFENIVFSNSVFSNSVFSNSVFEIAYNINNRNIPMLVGNFGVFDKQNYIYQIKNKSNIVYTNLDDYSKFDNDLHSFISDVGRMNNIIKL